MKLRTRTIGDSMVTLHENIRKDRIPLSKFMLRGHVRRNTKDRIEKNLFWSMGQLINFGLRQEW